MSDQPEQDRDPVETTEGKAVSEGGSAAQNPAAALGGADSVPDTPDVNTEVSDAVDINESSQEGEAPSVDDEGVPD